MPKCEADLQKLSVKDLRGMLRERGVEEGSATEKGDLVKWVWQHSHLPVIRDGREQQRRRSGKGRRGFGMGGYSDPYDYEDEPEDKKKEEEKPKGPEELEGADQQQRLLEAGEEAAADEESATSSWPQKVLKVIVFSVVGVFGALGALMILDSQRAEDTTASLQSASEDSREQTRV